MDGWTDGRTAGWMDGMMTGRWMDIEVNGWMSRWMDDDSGAVFQCFWSEATWLLAASRQLREKTFVGRHFLFVTNE